MMSNVALHHIQSCSKENNKSCVKIMHNHILLYHSSQVVPLLFAAHLLSHIFVTAGVTSLVQVCADVN